MPTIEVSPGEGVTLTIDGKPVVTVTRPAGSEAAPTIETPPAAPPQVPTPPASPGAPKPPAPPGKPEPPLQEMPL
jgi:hypothetical protein